MEVWISLKKRFSPCSINSKERYFNLAIFRLAGTIRMFEAKVTVQLKKGISDPEGANTLKAIHLLGFKKVQQVKKDVEQICQRLLTNTVIHQYEITVEEKK